MAVTLSAGDIVLTDDDLQKIYVWVDSIPLSRPKRNISRDFSDGVMMAEIVHHYFPKLVELHNYSAANSIRQKLYNWSTLNQKVFKRLGYEVKKVDIESAVNCKPGVIEAILLQVQAKIQEFRARKAAGGGSPGGALASGTPTDAAAAGGAGFSAGPSGGSVGSHDGAHGAGSGPDSYAAVSGGYPDPASASAPVARALVLGPAPAPHHASAPHAAAPAPSTTPAGAAGAGSGASDVAALSAAVLERDATIGELRETVEILELKIKKLEQLVKLKDQRIQTLMQRLQGGAATAPSAAPSSTASVPGVLPQAGVPTMAGYGAPAGMVPAGVPGVRAY